MFPTNGEFRILDFDIENRPSTYWWGDKTTAQITAIAWGWADESDEDIVVRRLGIDDPLWTLSLFKAAYDRADMVTAHFVSRHDLPIINAHLMKFDLPILGPKLVCDTKTQFTKRKDMPATQEYICEMLGIPAPKIHMTQMMWEESNNLTPKGLQYTYDRVRGDVVQHKQMRPEMNRRGLLHQPRVWRP